MLQSFEIGTGWIWIENYKYSKGHLKSCNSCNFQSNRWRLVVSNAASRFVCREPNMRFVTPNAVEQHRGTKVLSRPHWEWDHWCENNVPEKSHARAIQKVSSNAKHRHRQQSQTLTVLPTPHFMERNRTTLLLVLPTGTSGDQFTSFKPRLELQWFLRLMGLLSHSSLVNLPWAIQMFGHWGEVVKHTESSWEKPKITRVSSQGHAQFGTISTPWLIQSPT